MIITDVTGGKLKLLKRTLTEVTGERVVGDKWTVNLTSLKHPEEDSLYVKLHRETPFGKVTGSARYIPEERIIGCRTFDKKNFSLILKAIKAVK